MIFIFNLIQVTNVHLISSIQLCISESCDSYLNWFLFIFLSTFTKHDGLYKHSLEKSMEYNIIDLVDHYLTSFVPISSVFSLSCTQKIKDNRIFQWEYLEYIQLFPKRLFTNLFISLKFKFLNLDITAQLSLI